ncbi:MAG: hypothetical protein MSH66_01055 [Bacteroidales bacterium]|nr:hypothetical protein [Bacteroidales bacterium]
MKKHISLFLTFILMACLSAGAQDNQAELKSKVNEIKKSPDYIYAETTRETAEEAKSAAEEQLYNNINIWVAQEKKLRGAKQVIVAQAKADYEEYQLQRGNMVRAFLYVKKSDIIAADNVRVLDVNPLKEDEAKEDEAQQPAADPQPATPAVEISPLVKELAGIATIQAFGTRIKELKAQGKVGVYGKYKELTDPDNCLLVIYNRQGTIEAVLTAGAQRYNAATALPDAIANYPGCAAIGFTLK